MRKQTFNKIKKTLAILLAVFFVITLTAASASACGTKTAETSAAPLDVTDEGCGMTEEQKTQLGDQLLNYADNKLLSGNLGGGGMGALGGLFGDNWNTQWLGNDFGNGLGYGWGNDGYGNGLGNYGYGNGCNYGY